MSTVASFVANFIVDIAFDLEGCVKQYPYRTALARDVFMEMTREGGLKDLLDDIETQLAEAAGAICDNHTVYEVVTTRGNRLYIQFHDSDVYFGLSVDTRQ